MKNDITTTNDISNVSEVFRPDGNYSPKETNDHTLGSKAQTVAKTLTGVFATLAVTIGAVGSFSLLPTTADLPTASFVELATTQYGVVYYVETSEMENFKDFSVVVSNYFVDKTDFVSTEEVGENGFAGEVIGLKPNMEYKVEIKYNGSTIASQTVRTKTESHEY